MPTKKSNEQRKTKSANAKSGTAGRGQDRRKVAGGQEHEVEYETKKTGKPKEAVKASIKKVGNEREDVEEDLNM